MSWALTEWGLICQRIADKFVEAYPQFTIGIGPDPADLAEMGPRLTFEIRDGSIIEPKNGGSDEAYPTFDELLPVTIKIHVPTNIDSATKYDQSPLLAEAAKKRLLFEIHAERHVPWFVPRTIARRGGRIGEAGTDIIIGAEIRIENFSPVDELSPVTTTTIGLSVEAPDGSTERIEVNGVP